MTQDISTRKTVIVLVLAVVAALAIGATVMAGGALAQDNEVEFDGEISLEGDPADDGATYQYQLSDSVTTSDGNLTLTGVVADVEETATGDASSPTTIEVDGDRAPTDESIGVAVDNQGLTHYSGTKNRDTATDNPFRLHFNEMTALSEVTEVSYESGVFEYSGCGNGPYSAGETKTEEPYSVQDTTLFVEGENWSVARPDSGHWTENTLTGSTDVDGDTLNLSTEFPGYPISDQQANYCVRDVTVSGPNGTTVNATIGGQSEQLTEGEQTPIDLSTGSQDVALGTDLNATWTASWTEHAATTDPEIEVNGETLGYSGTMSSGQSESWAVPSEWLTSGSNSVNVSTGMNSGVETTVDLNYSHAAASSFDVSYAAQAWSERYNISRSFPSAQSGAELTIPFESSRVVGIRDVQIHRDGGWGPAAPSQTSLNGTTLSVDLGDVDADEAVGIRANGTKVDVETGEIDVVQPTIEGNSLATRFDVVDDGGSNSLAIEVGGTVSGNRLHYLPDSSWDANERSRFGSSGSQTFRLPEAPQGGTATVATAPLGFGVDGSEAVVLPGDISQPRFSIRPGASPDDVVSVRYFDTDSGETYDLLNAESNSVVDRATASSPVVLETTDEEMTYTIAQTEREDSGGTAGGGGGGGGALGPIPAEQNPTPWTSLGIPLGILAVAAGIALLFYTRVSFGSDSSQGASTDGPLEYVSSIAGRGGSWFAAHPTVSAGLGGVVAIGLLAFGGFSVPAGTAPAVFTVGVPIATYLGLQRVGRFDWMVWGLTTGAAVVIGLIWMGVDLFSQLINSQVALIVAIGGLYLTYRGIKSYRQGNTQDITIQADGGDGQ